MTHAPEIGAENRLHFSGGHFWSMCHTNLGPDSSGPETGMHMAEMMICRRLLFIFVTSCKQSVNSRFVIYLFIVIHFYVSYSRVYFCARNFHSGRIWYEKPAPENGADLWRRFLERVSWV